MAEPAPSDFTSGSEIQSCLNTIAGLLREVPHLSPEAQRLLADFVEELSKVVAEPTVPSEEMKHLAECTAHLVQAVHQKQEEGILAAARTQMDKAIVRVEAQMPTAAGLGRRLIEVLSNLGI